MKNLIKKITPLILALISCFMLCNVAFAVETVQHESIVKPIEAKILYVPLKNRIVFNQSPKSPKGIVVELKYSDGTVVTEGIAVEEDGYYLNGELVEAYGRVDMVIYGITSANYYINQGEVDFSYKYLSLPSINYFFSLIFN